MDRAHLARCLELAERYRGKTSPNPIVGCVIVDRRGTVIAEGAHAGPGTAHAEIAALKQLKGGKAKGATLYVNLEPCNHHGRTPPCAPVVRDSGVARVVIGMPDPIADHSGGIAVLKAAKIAVTTDILREPCERANLPFVMHARYGRPAFTLKAAITLDGKIATVSGESQWITGEAARADVMRQRSIHDAVMVGVGTVLADDPALTARVKGGRDPIRIILDGMLRTPPTARLLEGATPPGEKSAGPRVIIVTGMNAPAEREAALIARGADVWCVPADEHGRLDLDAVALMLGDSKITSVLVEGGGEVHASLLAQGLADQLVVYVAPKIVGGPAKTWVGGAGIGAMNAALPFVFDDEVTRLGDDLRLTGIPVRAGGQDSA